jgi:hypothetical protein
VLDASGYPVPRDRDEINRRLTALERLFALTASSRSLTNASIGGGGLRVYGGGSIKIEGSGSLYIESGNLILKDGVIDGDALEDQVQVEFFSTSSTSFETGTAWGTAATIPITPPAWATSTVVACQATLTLPTVGAIRGFLTGTDTTLEIFTASRNFGEDTNTVASLAWGGITTGAFTASVDARVVFASTETTPKRADLQVTCIHMR